MQKQLHEGHRTESADHAENGVNAEFQRTHQLVRRNVEQRLVAQDEVQHHPGRGRTQHHRAEHRRVHVAQNFFERKQHGRDRRIERRRQRRRAAHRHQRLHVRRAQTETPADHRGDPGADLHRRAFAAERDAARQRNRAAQKFAEHRAQRDVPVADEQRELRLRDAAAARIGKIAEQQIAAEQRARRGNQHAPPRRALGRIHARRQPARQQDERDDREPDDRRR